MRPVVRLLPPASRVLARLVVEFEHSTNSPSIVRIMHTTGAEEALHRGFRTAVPVQTETAVQRCHETVQAIDGQWTCTRAVP